MKTSQLARLTLKHARNALAEEMYIRNIGDMTRPVAVYGIVNERCNYKCRYCEYWRLENYVDEMSIEEWQAALLSLKEYIGRFHIEFSGGEPFIKKGFLDLVEFCHREGIIWGVTTNGSALQPKVIERVVAAQPFNFNISMDSHLAEVHNYSRGIDGSLDRVVEGLGTLLRARDHAGLKFPVIVKPVVHKLNFRHLPEMVEWAQQVGASVINFQPIDRWTRETYDELWIEEEDLDELDEVVEVLLAMKRAGKPIMNSLLTLENWRNHYLENPAPPETMPCRVGMRNYFIRTNGDVEVCWFYPPIGNVKKQSAKEIWSSEEARKRRAETAACDRLCLFTCLSQKTLTDKAKMGVALLAGRKNKRLAGNSAAAPIAHSS